jgi:predicted Rossmann fold nucleotide-binding protein DprA/Smf involved in DNA uptake
MDHPLQIIDRNSPSFPVLLIERLGKEVPHRLWAIGSLDLLSVPKTAIFCSRTCPGHAILQAMDQAQQWRDEGRCVISGFHSPIEKECLNILLLRGVQPMIICPARGLEQMRIPKQWRTGIDAGRMLIVSPFDPSQHRLTAALSDDRNRLVAALADEICFVHVAPAGRIGRLVEQVSGWGIPKIG